MSYSTLFGAIVAPCDAPDPFAAWPDDLPQCRGSSRSGSFHTALRDLLDAFPGHDALRILSGQSGGREVRDAGGRTLLTVLDAPGIAATTAALDDLFAALPRQPDRISAVVLDHCGGASVEEMLAALAGATACRDINRDARHGDDGQSPEFFFAALASLRSLLAEARARSMDVACFVWMPA